MKWKQDLDLPSGEREERKLQVQPVRGKTSQINLGVTITEKIEFSQVAGGDFSSCVPESLLSPHPEPLLGWLESIPRAPPAAQSPGKTARECCGRPLAQLDPAAAPVPG